MLPGIVVLVADKPARSVHLAEALNGIGTCKTVEPAVDWSALASVVAVVADLDLSRPAAIHCLRALKAQPWAASAPVLCVSHSLSDRSLRRARSLGVSLCLPFYLDAHVIVVALLNTLKPDEGTINASARQCVKRAGNALSGLFAAAQATGRVSLEAVGSCIDPVVSALAEGGLARWLNAIRTHDDASYRHSLVVAGLAAQFANHLRFPDAQKRRLVRAALVQDVGKARVPRALLLKRGALNPSEAAVMRTHPELGHEILVSSGEADATLLDAVRHHHEMLDGSGYPDGLRGEAVSNIVRVLSICDVYAALTEHRSYHEAMRPVQAMRILNEMNGKVDPSFLQAFGQAIVPSEVA